MESSIKILNLSKNKNPLIYSHDSIHYLKKEYEKEKYRSYSFNYKEIKDFKNNHFKAKSNEFLPKIESKNNKPLIKEKTFISPDNIRKKRVYKDIDYGSEYKNLALKESKSFIKNEFRKNSNKINKTNNIKILENKYFSPVLKEGSKRNMLGSVDIELNLFDNNIEEENKEIKNEDKIEEIIDETKNNTKKLSLSKPVIIRKKKKYHTEKKKIK